MWHFPKSLFQHFIGIQSLPLILWWSHCSLWFLLGSPTRWRSAGCLRRCWSFAGSGWRRCTPRSVLSCLSSFGVFYWWSWSLHRFRSCNTGNLRIRSTLTTVYSAAFNAVVLTGICYDCMGQHCRTKTSRLNSSLRVLIVSSACVFADG